MSVRRLPVYLVLDCSESMVGEAIDAVTTGVRDLTDRLQSDPHAIETVVLSVIAFGGRARQLIPLTEVMNFRPPNLIVEPGTHLGGALRVLSDCLTTQVRTSTPTVKGDYKPMVFLLTDGQPTDDWRSGLKEFQSTVGSGRVNLIAVALGEAVDLDVLRAVTPTVLQLPKLDSGALLEFFKWVSSSVSSVSAAFNSSDAAVRTPDLPAGVGAAPTGQGVDPRKPPTQLLLLTLCQGLGKPYLMRYRRSADGGYDAHKAFPVTQDYLSLAAAGPVGKDIDADQLRGSPACPHCGKLGWRPAKNRVGLECHDRVEAGGSGKAQVMFVLDITGSMAGEIAGVKDNIAEFVSYIRKEGLAVEVGLVAFRDLEQREPPEVLTFGGGSMLGLGAKAAFTSDPAVFRTSIGKLTANGGGGNPGESAYDGLATACRQLWAEGVARILVLITDEPPLLPDGKIRTVDDVGAAFKAARIDQLHIVIPHHLMSIYAPLHRYAPGQVFELSARGGEGFRQILLGIGKSISITTRMG